MGPSDPIDAGGRGVPPPAGGAGGERSPRGRADTRSSIHELGDSSPAWIRTPNDQRLDDDAPTGRRRDLGIEGETAVGFPDESTGVTEAQQSPAQSPPPPPPLPSQWSPMLPPEPPPPPPLPHQSEHPHRWPARSPSPLPVAPTRAPSAQPPASTLPRPPSLPMPSSPPPRLSGRSVPPGERMPVRAPNPAREMVEARPVRPIEPAPEPASQPSAPPHRERPLELLWFDAKRANDVTAQPDFAPHAPVAPPPLRRERPGRGPGLLDEDPPEASEQIPPRQTFSAVLRRAAATPLAQLERVMEEHLLHSDTILPPLVLVDAHVFFGFDVRQELEQLVATAKPLAKGQRKLADGIGHAEEMLTTPLEAAPGIARATADQLRKAWRETNRMLPADYLDTTVERALLTKRAYEKRQLLDDVWLRALALGGDARERHSVVMYLPNAIANSLPLFRELAVRMIADVLPRQDGDETSPVCLRVVALARRVGAELP